MIIDFEEKLVKFDCGNPEINQALEVDIKYDNHHLQRTYLAINDDNDICGFITFAIIQISHMDIEEEEDIIEGHGPAVLTVKTLGVDINYKKKGIAKKLIGIMMRIAVSIYFMIPIQGIYLESVANSVNFYKRLGFQNLNGDPVFFSELTTYKMGIGIDFLIDVVKVYPYETNYEMYEDSETKHIIK